MKHPTLLICTTLALLAAAPGKGLAHHGVATLGAAGLQGPGAPVETSSSAALPRGKWLGYMKLDYVDFKTYTPARDDETDYNAFWMAGLGYGFTPYLSAYVFVPYNEKSVQDDSFDSSGIADISLLGVLGFKYYDGFHLVPDNESLDDLEDWHFTVYSGVSLPSGNANLHDSGGEIHPDMSTGFGKPAFNFGLTATKPLSDRLTAIAETSYLYFQDYGYSDGNHAQFGAEFRTNGALAYRAFTFPEWSARVDLNMEAAYLHLGRDRDNGEHETASGGNILYLVPGLRAYWKNFSMGLAVKLPTITDLNEESLQQGSEGKEDYRLLWTLSAIL